MRALNRKLARNLWSLKGQAIAISLVIAAGVAMYTGYLSTFEALGATLRAYYERYRFAEVFVGVKRAPLGLRDRVADIPGVAHVDARVVVDVTLDVPGLTEPASGRLIGIPIPKRTTLNDIFLREGRFPSPEDADEALVSEGFARARDLGPGDTLGAIINGRRRTLQIVGVALSPEYVYSIRPGELMPDNARFGVFWMNGRALASAFDMEGAFNSLALTLRPDASLDDVMARVDRLAAPYGGAGAVPRALQTSHWYLANELAQLETMGLVMPVIFLGVAAFLLNVVLTRIVSVQREQIAALKALGYSNRELAWHFVKLALAIGIAGAALGTAAGAWLGGAMTTLYNEFFRFPTLLYGMPPATAVQGMAISVLASVSGAFSAVRRAVALPPAEAMRPEPPARYRVTLLERAGLSAWLSPSARMVLRNVARHPVRAGTAILGIAMSAALLVVGTFSLDSIDVILDLQFGAAQRQDVTVSFVEPAAPRAMHELRRLPGVTDAEPIRAVAARLRHGTRARQVGLTGLVASPRLMRIVDEHGRPMSLPPDGLVMSAKLGEVLDVRPGDEVRVEVLEGRRTVATVPVVGLVDDYMGLSAYMHIDAVRALMHEGAVITGAALAVDARHEPQLYRRLTHTPRVAGVALKRRAIESFHETFAEMFYIIIVFNLIFSGIIAFGVVYNAARVSLSERSRELASLRVLGFTRGEISSILLGELAVVTLTAVPLGLLLGYGGAAWLVTLFDTELYRFPLIVLPRTYAYAALAVLGAAAVSALAVRRRLDHLDLVAVLKTRE